MKLSLHLDSGYFQTEGAFFGLCLGDALARTHTYKNPSFLLHGATGTWFLSVAQTLTMAQSNSIQEELALKLQVLSAPFHALALRSKDPSLGQTLKKVAEQYARCHEVKSSATEAINADILPCLIPLVFLNRSPGERMDAFAQVVTCTHIHPRVILSGALLVGSLLALAESNSQSLEEVLDKGQTFALTAASVFSLPSFAKQALLHHVALGKGVSDPSDLGFPYGFDGRDSPEQLVVLALALSEQSEFSTQAILHDVIERGGASDILAPLLGGILGFRRGVGAFPAALRNLLLGQSVWWETLSLYNPRVSHKSTSINLVEEEIKLSFHEDALLKAEGSISSTSSATQQLAFF